MVGMPKDQGKIDGTDAALQDLTKACSTVGACAK